ncbi:PLP-dependent aminotransferase family protein [Knoellia koreensis]|uniref:PLP-dependent aminotransferase family protein n=1 Tax=Knoellia koreensis TaxID=2730921 RepID=A0A849HHS2_9MICO|nr:PLP-dependent aminotransferase family protein [Knoellia sp. DB2414S]NNM46124.1 PLP-dependent aminotransferase family protein [Knoellia sp. DB2414S]
MAPPAVPAHRLVPLLGSALETTPAYRGLADALRLLIADGRLPVGTRLPSERDLTAALGVSRTTVSSAYAALRDSGYLQSRRGSGSVTSLPGDATGSRARVAGSALRPGQDLDDADVIDLTCAAMPAPVGTIAAYEAAVAALPHHLGGTGYHPLGLPELREAVAARYTERGLATTPDQVMVTSGALAGIAVATRALLGAGDRVLVENPTYPNAIEAFRRAGARTVPLSVTAEGWDVPTAEATLRQTAPRAAYLVPDFHNPTGALMPEEQRAQLGAALAASHTVAIVDETMVDLAHDARLDLPRPFGAFHARTVTAGGASKSFWGGLRVGWVRAPRDVVASLLAARLTLDLGAPVLEQLAMLHLLDHRDEVLAHRREVIVTNRDAFVGELRKQLPQWRFHVPSGGLCLWVELPEALSTALCVAADRRGLVLAAGPQFGSDGAFERFIRLPFTGLPSERVADAVERLAAAWDEATTRRSTRGTRPPLVA